VPGSPRRCVFPEWGCGRCSAVTDASRSFVPWRGFGDGLYASNGMTWLALLVVQRERCRGRFPGTGLGWTSRLVGGGEVA
jgi:hypothetical protein